MAQNKAVCRYVPPLFLSCSHLFAGRPNRFIRYSPGEADQALTPDSAAPLSGSNDMTRLELGLHIFRKIKQGISGKDLLHETFSCRSDINQETRYENKNETEQQNQAQ